MNRLICCILFVVFRALALGTTAYGQDWRPMTFRADAPGIDENPLRGLIPYSLESQQGFPHSMEWFYTPLSDVIVGEDTYDWRPVDRELEKIAGRGDQAAFRFYLDFPGKPSAIPRYLLDAGLKTFSYDDFENATSPMRSVAPDQSDFRLIACLIAFIRALGARYDGDPRIAYLTAGLVGFWGEWHVNAHPHAGEPAGWQMSQDDKDALLTTYRDSFRKTMVLVRSANVTPQTDILDNFGFHDDSFLDDTLGNESWHFWQEMTDAGMQDSWRNRPTGGEIYPRLQATLWDAWPNPGSEDIGTAIATTHATWMIDYDLFARKLTPSERANALRSDRMLGYTLYCSAVRLERGPGGAASISVKLENRGTAPFYARWPVEIEAVDGRNVLAEGFADWPVTTLLPGETSEYHASFHDLPRKPATIVIRLVNSLANGHPVAFANAEMGTVKPGWLTLGKIQP